MSNYTAQQSKASTTDKRQDSTRTSAAKQATRARAEARRVKYATR